MSNAARIAAATALTFAAAAAAFANASTSGVEAVFVPGRQFGIGEQHVYAVQTHTVLVVRLRSAEGVLTTKTLRSDRRSSVALTVDRYDASGNPVFAIAAWPAGAQGDLAPATAVLRGLNSGPLTPHQSWGGDANIRVPFAGLALHLHNVAGSATGDASQTTMVVNSDGRDDVSGSVHLQGIGSASLRGGGGVTGTSFLELDRQLLLGLKLAAQSSGVATASNVRGTYALSMSYSVELARFVAGNLPASESPQFTPASTYGGSPAPIDTTNIGPAPLGTLGQPAPIDTEYAPLPDSATTATSGPAVSLPPIPVVAPSDQQLVSPPPPPTPTPTPRH